MNQKSNSGYWHRRSLLPVLSKTWNASYDALNPFDATGLF